MTFPSTVKLKILGKIRHRLSVLYLKFLEPEYFRLQVWDLKYLHLHETTSG